MGALLLLHHPLCELYTMKHKTAKMALRETESKEGAEREEKKKEKRNIIVFDANGKNNINM